MSTWWKEIAVKKAMLLPSSPPPSLEGDNDTLGTGVAEGGDHALPESLHILSALVRVVEQVFKEPEKC